MIDFIRLVYDDKEDIEEYILLKENFDKVYTIFEYHSGEILYPYKASCENMEVGINNKVVFIKNSIHKLYNVLENNGEQNHNDLTYSKLSGTINYLRSKFIGLDDAKLTVLEFGLNISTPIPAEDIIRGNIIRHGGEEYSHRLKFKGKGEYMQFDHTDYYIKVYDKAKQYGLIDNILRFEIKFIRKREFNKLDVYNITDLLNKDILRRLFDYLLKRFDNMVIIDDFSYISCEVDKAALNTYTSRRYWTDLSKQYSRQTKSIHKKKFSELLAKYDLLKTRNNLRQSLIDKFHFLISN
ncbi:hypothetical protein OGH69_15350 [Flavobacterium sp. MFBS3-15]|uniref:hypothetical protein n=1 Tax=Flavobacterium sp. MFBS3-15 TaxID=2989816 RepID=UPI002235B5D5|nr:hypothetical protein [Flavobacterium sp. MFBS3-15]MCW4470349.1 hypothetical protein [Flavobacterium sp. MFBS3-15]